MSCSPRLAHFSLGEAWLHLLVLVLCALLWSCDGDVALSSKVFSLGVGRVSSPFSALVIVSLLVGCALFLLGLKISVGWPSLRLASGSAWFLLAAGFLVSSGSGSCLSQLASLE